VTALPATAPPAASTPGPLAPLDAWLAWQGSLHVNDIVLGLERCRAVAARMGLLPVPHTVIAVGGTNGKGSTVAMLERIYRVAGYRVGAYTSPHLVRYNERIRVDGEAADDARLCAAFARVEAARQGVPLTVFEFGTLAALEIFAASGLDLAILEVGMGGRLDAVNIVDADVAVIAAIGIDHVEFLGTTREAIAIEKAGIMRRGRPAVCSDPWVPESLVAAAAECGALLALLGQSFHFSDHGASWTWWSDDTVLEELPPPGLRGDYQLRNAAGVLKAVQLLTARLPVNPTQIARGLAETRLPGRFQRVPGEVELVLDVAHNAQAVDTFVATLLTLPPVPATHVVLGMLITKDHVSVMRSLNRVADSWQLATVSARHGASSADLERIWRSLSPRRPVACHDGVPAALAGAHRAARPGDRIVVVGSFITVGQVLALGPPDRA
jgi:dihydrofolate synthase/folylpolyglutamate synthase